MSNATMERMVAIVERNAHVLPVCIGEALASPTARGTMRAWMQRHNGRAVGTVQVTNYSVWAPAGRTLDASRSTYATFDGSRRDYAGLRVVHADDECLIVDSEHETIAYMVQD